uniref:Uncharacterized protein n=1 Tax=Arundo donax TaxID=35708 RepID=A0A0A9ABL6_ARUDO
MNNKQFSISPYKVEVVDGLE